MLKIPKKHLPLTMVMLGTLLANFSTVVNANTIVRQVIVAGGGQMTAGGNTLSYTIGQPIISTDYSFQPISGFWPIYNNGNVTLGIGSDIMASSCNSFDVTIQVQAPDEQEVDTASAYINFDPSTLKVVKLTPAPTLELALQKQFDNTTGHIDFSAATFSPVPPKGTFDLLTITLQAKRQAQTALVFNTKGTRTTDVLLAAESVFTGADNIVFTITNSGTLVGQVANFPNRQLRVHVSPPVPEDFHQVTSDGNGKFTLPGNFTSGTYEIYVSASNTLQVKKSVTLASCQTKTIRFGNLKAGDLIGSGTTAPDNWISIHDFSIFNAYVWNKGIPSVDYNLDGTVDAADSDADFREAHFDLNNDNTVGADDRNVIVTNFAKTGDNKVGGPYLRRGLRSSKVTVPDLSVGDGFEIMVSVPVGEHFVDAVAVQLNFEPSLLQVNHIKPGNTFDTLLQSEFDNDSGQIHFAAGHTVKETPRGTIELMTIGFTVIGKGGEQTLSLDMEAVSGGQTMPEVTEKTDFEKCQNASCTVAESFAMGGTILDKQGNPIAGVNLQVGNQTALTDENGKWEITSLAAGEYNLIASKDGYLSQQNQCTISVLSDNQDCQPNFKLPSALDVKVKAQPQIAQQGENITYFITVTNQGAQTATDVVITDELPEDTDLVSIETDTGNCDANTVTCSLQALSPGATATVTIEMTNTQAVKKLKNTATVTTNEYPTDVQVTQTTVIPYLSVSIMDTPEPVATQNMLHYVVTASLSKYAPSPATGVELVFTLPNSVELQSISALNGMCDTSEWPQITCSLIDLSVDSQVTIDFEVKLQDAGLLLLISEAQVSANEYPIHTDRERTQIQIPDVEVDIAFVIDVTGSMQAEINDVITALKTAIGEIEPNDAPLIALVIFTDEVKVKAVTQDLNVLLDAVEKLKVKGGGACPEAAVEALQIAIPHTKAEGYILFATDASPYDDADVESVIESLRNKAIRFNAIITGDCTQKESWNELPNDN